MIAHGRALHRSPRSVPLALRANLQHNHVVHQRVVIICAVSEDVPTVPAAERLRVDETEYIPDGLVRVSARYGFKEDQDIAGVLGAARFPEVNWRSDTMRTMRMCRTLCPALPFGSPMRRG